MARRTVEFPKEIEEIVKELKIKTKLVQVLKEAKAHDLIPYKGEEKEVSSDTIFRKIMKFTSKIEDHILWMAVSLASDIKDWIMKEDVLELLEKAESLKVEKRILVNATISYLYGLETEKLLSYDKMRMQSGLKIYIEESAPITWGNNKSNWEVFLNNLFVWSETPEGYSFWRKISLM